MPDQEIEQQEDQQIDIGSESSVPDGSEEQRDQSATPEGGEDAAEEVVVSIGDDAPAEGNEGKPPAPQWVRNLRKDHQAATKRIRELEAMLNANAAQAKTEVGKKPALGDPDIDYDEDKYAEAMDAWYSRKRKAEEEERSAQAEQQRAKQEWQQRVETYNESKAKLRVPDYEDAELLVQETLDQTQQGIIVHGAENPALLVYALGKNPAEAKRLAAIKDPVKYAFALAKVEAKLKVSPKNSAPPPEKKVGATGGARISGAVDSTLNRLREDAERTGDYSKVIAYKRQQKERA